MKNKILILIFIAFFGSCIRTQDKLLLLDYEAFGPPSCCYEIIGNDWWQWQSHGDSSPRKYDIKVVVYNDIPLRKVKKLYPVIKEKEEDYRYLEYNKAILFLEKRIKENILEEVSEHLKKTKSILEAHF